MNDLEALQARIKGDESELKKFTWPGGWPGEIEAALIDAVFSIRARYGTGENGVRGVVKRWRDERGDVLDDLRALADGELWRAVVPYAKIHYRKFKAAFEASLADLSLHSLNLLGDDHADGAALPPQR